MRLVLTILLVFSVSIYSFGQKNYGEIYNSHIFSCDSGTGTVEMNICSGVKVKFADSLLNKLYKKILTSLNK